MYRINIDLLIVNRCLYRKGRVCRYFFEIEKCYYYCIYCVFMKLVLSYLSILKDKKRFKYLFIK